LRYHQKNVGCGGRICELIVGQILLMDIREGKDGALVSKKSGGAWKIQCDIWNPDMPMPGSEPKQ
jgi:hypothetical protein